MRQIVSDTLTDGDLGEKLRPPPGEESRAVMRIHNNKDRSWRRRVHRGEVKLGGAGGGQGFCRSAYLLVCQHGAALKWRQVAVEQDAGSVVLTEDCPVDVMEAIAWHQSVPTGGTAETLEVVNISLHPHHHLVGWDRLTAGAARPAVPEQPDVVAPTQNHAPFAVAGGADVPQLGLAAGALEAASVPVALHGEEKEAVGDLAPASCTRPGDRRPA